MRPADCARPSGHCAPGVLSMTHALRPLLPGARPVGSLPSPLPHTPATCVELEAGEGHVGSVMKSPPQPGPAGWDAGHKEAVGQGPGGQPLCRERTGPELDVLGAGE